jgi:hypothetical protein
MVLHHVPYTIELFKIWQEMLLPGGQLCLADLDTEDGSFHSDKTGVFHFGFNREHLKLLLHSAGFSEARDVTATTCWARNWAPGFPARCRVHGSSADWQLPWGRWESACL